MGFLRKAASALLAAIMLTFAAGGDESAEAADLYSVIYSDVAMYNGSNEEREWITNAIMYSSGTYGVDPYLITAVMQTESAFNIGAYSPKGAIGLMQLMPETAAEIGVDPYNPLQNVTGGTAHLGTLINTFAPNGEYGVTYAVAAYNAGSQAVIDYGGVPPYSETVNYVIQVANAYNNLLYMGQY